MTECNYWLGPFDVRVPNTIKCVIDEDDCNILYFDGYCTEKGCTDKLLTKEQYLEKYTEKRDDGFYWYVGKKKTFEWGKSLEPSLEVIEEHNNKKAYAKSDLKTLPVLKL